MREGFRSTYESKPWPELKYPFEAIPDFGQAVDIAAGVKWLRMPLGGSLGAINVWAIAEAGGWAIVDTGLGGEPTMETWRAAFAGPLKGLPVTRVFVTHLHPDHIGMAGWLTRKFDVRLWISRLEFLMCRSLTADTGREAPEDGVRFYREAGWSEEQIETYRARFGGFGRAMHALPDSFHRLSDGDEIRIGDHLWRVVTGAGHSPEHACLHCPDLQVFITGDQVLPRITSNVSVFPTEPENDPLSEWLSSLAKLKTRVGDEVLVLPAHNEPFFGLHTRLEHLIDGHERAMDRLVVELAAPKRAVDVFHVLFRRNIDTDQISLATGESIAHLNCLIRRGRVLRERDAAGVNWYRAAA